MISQTDGRIKGMHTCKVAAYHWPSVIAFALSLMIPFYHLFLWNVTTEKLLHVVYFTFYPFYNNTVKLENIICISKMKSYRWF